MIVGSAIVLVALVVLSLLFLREGDLPKAAPVSPFQHLDERKASIYENLRDLQFEYRVGKLSDTDYQQTKVDLQKELAKVLAEVDRLKAELQVVTASVPAPSKAARVVTTAKSAKVVANGSGKAADVACAGCGALVPHGLKFCGECGIPVPQAKPLPVEGTVCPSCGAKFDNPMKFCGECGAAMTALRSRA
jgi:Double zinc ribbon